MVTACPETLHHYTTATGLLGILEPVMLGVEWQKAVSSFQENRRSISLWATDARYLNDSAEVRFAAKQLADALTQLAIGNPERNREIENVANRLREDDFTEPGSFFSQTAYVACFCSDGDLLSQWRGYGSNGGGYSIEFCTSALRELWFPRFESGHEQDETSLCRVRYGIDPEVEIIDRVVTVAVANARFGLMSEAVKGLAQFKHQAFGEESEWRVVYTGPSPVLQFRTTVAGSLIPYVKLFRVESPEERVSAIRSVRVGPGPDQNLRAEAVRQLLDQRGFTDVTVNKSAITYRG